LDLVAKAQKAIANYVRLYGEVLFYLKIRPACKKHMKNGQLLRRIHFS
jgi:hypothetical protein